MRKMDVPRARTPATSLPGPSPNVRSFLRARLGFALDLALARGFAGVRLRFPVDFARGFFVLVCFDFSTVAKLSPLTYMEHPILLETTSSSKRTSIETYT